MAPTTAYSRFGTETLWLCKRLCTATQTTSQTWTLASVTSFWRVRARTLRFWFGSCLQVNFCSVYAITRTWSTEFSFSARFPISNQVKTRAVRTMPLHLCSSFCRAQMTAQFVYMISHSFAPNGCKSREKTLSQLTCKMKNWMNTKSDGPKDKNLPLKVPPSKMSLKISLNCQLLSNWRLRISDLVSETRN